ncbi:hypothetical protein OSB04_022789 [Centaurea solstitialis]|uniref:Non-specific lipid-transfer protein n=1 Tax=Centaurea solstitialis TaxID=347529 RepID=A0AA38VYY4_9ASTR|nr:hypothetical protein OSB04_022789 [Centaurea solstitialis]
MAGGMLMKMACVMVACMVVLAPPTEANINCGQVASSVLPCLSYLRSGGALGGCCNGVRALNNAARTTANRKIACVCLKNAYAAYHGFNPANAASSFLPSVVSTFPIRLSAPIPTAPRFINFRLMKMEDDGVIK